MDTFLNLKTFVLVAKYQSFTYAARQLDVVPSVVARRIGQLEKFVSAKLIERTTRSMRLTEAGEKLYARAGPMLSSFDDLLDSVQRDESKLVGHIRVAVPTTLNVSFLGQLFTEFLIEQDRITMDIVLQDDAFNPAERGLDLAISGRSASYEGVTDIPLCPTGLIACAAPGYLARRGTPLHPRELADHDCLAFRPFGLNWQFSGPRGMIDIEVVPKLVADDNMTLLRGAAGGLGITLLPHYIARNGIEAGRLVKIFDEFLLPETWFNIYRRARQWLCRIALFAQFPVSVPVHRTLCEVAVV